MALSHQLVTTNASTPTILTIPFASEPDYSHSIAISVQNTDGSNTVYLGSSNVTSSNYGYALAPNGVFSMDLLPVDDLYAIASAGSPALAVIKVTH